MRIKITSKGGVKQGTDVYEESEIYDLPTAVAGGFVMSGWAEPATDQAETELRKVGIVASGDAMPRADIDIDVNDGDHSGAASSPKPN